jgi:hypothetical protein
MENGTNTTKQTTQSLRGTEAAINTIKNVHTTTAARKGHRVTGDSAYRILMRVGEPSATTTPRTPSRKNILERFHTKKHRRPTNPSTMPLLGTPGSSDPNLWMLDLRTLYTSS